jgi:hypothetical protein
MKLKSLVQKCLHPTRLIQSFGPARLVRHANGRYELIGGSRAEFAAAHEWISLFGHEIVLTPPADLRHPLPESNN